VTRPTGGNDFDHFVITRFSAVFTPDQPPADEAWLEYRLAFFVQASCAALERQRPGSEFQWLVYFDDRCSPEFRARIDVIADGLFEPIWTHEVFWSGVVPRDVAARSDAPFVVTTRLDSDDAVAIDFVESVQAAFDHQELLFVNFPRGLQVDRSGAVYRLDYPSNPFISMIERRNEGLPPTTVFGAGPHTKVRRLGQLLEVATHPLWMQVVHGSNLANGLHGTRTLPAEANRWFDIDLPYRTQVARHRFVVEWVVQRVRRGALWFREPRLAYRWAVARREGRRGTRLLPVWESPHR
jgi:hypothetical protein